jgi:hypothetical protein
MFRRGASGSRAGLRLGELMVVLDYNILSLGGGGQEDTCNNEVNEGKWIDRGQNQEPTAVHPQMDCRPRPLSPNIVLTLPTANDNRPRLTRASLEPLPSHLDGTQYESSWNEPCVENVRNDSTLLRNSVRYIVRMVGIQREIDCHFCSLMR